MTYILPQKIAVAKKLIESERTVSEIAAAVGVDDYNYFIVVFKRVTRCHPIATRSGFPEKSLKRFEPAEV